MKYRFSLILIPLLTFWFAATASAAGAVPDTGQTQYYTDTFGEDSDYLINPPSYTKLNANGGDLEDTADEWAMVRDNVTGLIWEVKQNNDTKWEVIKDNNDTVISYVQSTF